MKNIVSKIKEIQDRGEPVKNEKIEDKKESSTHLTGKGKVKKLYDYYTCDYCGEEIPILKEHYKQCGGIIEFKDSITGCGKVKLALCNKCLKPALKEMEENKHARTVRTINKAVYVSGH